MHFHRCLSVVAASTLLLPSTAHAQQAQSIPGDVTFELPVNLTRISGAISKVMVTCNISSAALAGSPNKKLAAQVELPVVAGQVVTTVGVVVPVTAESFLDPTMTDTAFLLANP